MVMNMIQTKARLQFQNDQAGLEPNPFFCCSYHGHKVVFHIATHIVACTLYGKNQFP